MKHLGRLDQWFRVGVDGPGKSVIFGVISGSDVAEDGVSYCTGAIHILDHTKDLVITADGQFTLGDKNDDEAILDEILKSFKIYEHKDSLTYL